MKPLDWPMSNAKFGDLSLRQQKRIRYLTSVDELLSFSKNPSVLGDLNFELCLIFDLHFELLERSFFNEVGISKDFLRRKKIKSSPDGQR